MIMPFKHEINSEIRKQTGKLISQVYGFLILVVDARSVKCLVKHDYMPVRIGLLNVILHPLNLLCAELLVFHIIGVEHREMDIVVIV